MKAMYLNGERVYMERITNLNPRSKERYSSFGGMLQIVKHDEIVRALNCIFQNAEDPQDEIYDDLSKIVSDLNLHSREENHRIKVLIIDPKVTGFDDPRIVKLKQRAKQAKLFQEEAIPPGCHIFKTILGGLHKPPAKPPVYDHLTPEFSAFLEKEQQGQEVTT